MRARYSRRFKRRVGRYRRRYRRKQTTRKRYQKHSIYKTICFKTWAAVTVNQNADQSYEVPVTFQSFAQAPDIFDSFEEFKIKSVHWYYIPNQNQTFAHSPTTGTSPAGTLNNAAGTVWAATINNFIDTANLNAERTISLENNQFKSVTQKLIIRKKVPPVLMHGYKINDNEDNHFDMSMRGGWIKCKDYSLYQAPGHVWSYKSNNTTRHDADAVFSWSLITVIKVIFRNYKNNALKL